MRVSVGQGPDDADPSQQAPGRPNAMPVGISTLDDEILSLVSVAANIHSRIQGYTKARTLSPLDVSCLKKIAGEILHLSGSLHSLRLLLSTLASDDVVSIIGTQYNLEHFRLGQQTVRRLDSDLRDASLYHPLQAGATEEINVNDSEHNALFPAEPLSHLKPARPYFQQSFSQYPSQLHQYRIQLGFALASESLSSLLATLSRRSISLDRPAPSWKERVPRITKKRCPFEPADHLEKLVAQRFGGDETLGGNWVDSQKDFLRWRNGGDVENAPHHLWLRGQAGAGKSVLVASIVQELLDRSVPASRTDDAVCFHFIDWRDRETWQAKNVLTAFLCQLEGQRAEAFNKLKTTSWNELDSSSATEQALKEGFAVIRSHFKSPVYVIIDGVDVLSQPSQFLETVFSAMSTLPDIRFLLSSRGQASVKSFCESIPGFSTLEAVPPESYIREYIQSSVGSRVDSGDTNMGAETGKSIVSVLSTRQNFRCVECQLDILFALPHDEDRLAQLPGLPQTLMETYSAVISPVMEAPGSVDSLLLKNTLCWVAKFDYLWSKLDFIRPTTDQLCQALAVVISPKATSTAELQPVNESRVSRLCGPLISVNDDLTWVLRHRTVHEHLLYVDPSYPNSGIFAVHEKDTEMAFATTLVRFLNFSDFDQFPPELEKQKSLMEERHARNPLFQYAAAWWPALSVGYWDELSARALHLFRHTNSGNFAQWMLAYCVRMLPIRYALDKPPSPFIRLTTMLTKGHVQPLHVAAALGMPPACRALVTAGEDVNANHPSGLGPPLLIALIGIQALRGEAVTCQPSTWTLMHETPRSLHQRETIHALIGLGADCSVRLPRTVGKMSGTITLASASFMAALVLCDAQLFIKVVNRGAAMDEGLLSTLTDVDLAHDISRNGQIWDKRPMGDHRKTCLSNLCEYIIESMIERIRDESDDPGPEPEDFLNAAWKMGEKCGLDCVQAWRKRRIPCDDEKYKSFAAKHIQTCDTENVIKRLMQDPRWEPNRTLREEDGREGVEILGQTVLHFVVEDSKPEMAKLLLENGSDHRIRDVKGRTPLHLAESKAVLKVLLDKGADLSAKDNEGRTIWHFAAANNDHAMIRALLEFSTPDQRDTALREATKQGRTPLAEAFSYVHELVNIGSRGDSLAMDIKAATLLLPHCKGSKEYFQSDIPLIHLAAEWGSGQLVLALADGGDADLGAVSADGSTALHCLNFSATRMLINLLRSKCGKLPLQRKDGKTPAETIFFNFRSGSVDDQDRNSHPSSTSKLTARAFEELLDPATIASKDDKGRTLWERFCEDISLHYAQKAANWSKVSPIIPAAVEALAKKGAICKYEEETQKSAVLPLMSTIWDRSKLIPPWLFSSCRTVLENSADRPYFDTAKDETAVVLTLRSAVNGNRLDVVQALLSRGVSIHRQARSISVLEESCWSGVCNTSVFMELVKYADRTKVNDTGSAKRSPLHSLCIEPDIPDREQRIKALIDAGADPDLPSKSEADGSLPPVVLAVLKSFPDAAITLLRNGADMKATSHNGINVAMAAAMRGSIGLLTYIQQEAGLDWDWKTTCSYSVTLTTRLYRGRPTQYQGCTALHLAAFYGQPESLKFYLENGYIGVDDVTSNYSMTPLHFAALGGSPACIRYLVSKGANLEAKSPSSGTPLYQAVKAGHLSAVTVLLDLGCEKAPRGPGNVTPFIESLRVNNIAIGFLLLPAPAEPRLVHFEPKTLRVLADAMDKAIRSADNTMVEAVLRHGCSPDTELSSCQGCPALMLAVRLGNASITRLLLDRGARRLSGACDQHSHRPCSVVHEACRHAPSLPCLRIVLDAALRLDYNWVQDHSSPLHTAADYGNVGALREIVNHVKENAEAYSKWLPDRRWIVNPNQPPDPESRSKQLIAWLVNLRTTAEDDDYTGSTPLHSAAEQSENLEAIRFLIDNGADLDQQDERLYTPLHVAIDEDELEAAELLLQRGANPNTCDTDGHTPLVRACQVCRLAAVKLLLRYGADPHVYTPDGQSLLNCAADAADGPPIFHYLVSEVGLDPYAPNRVGFAPLHLALLRYEFTAHVLSGAYDLERLADVDEVYKGLIAGVVENEEGDVMLPRMLRRWPPDQIDRYINVWPLRYVSPLCNVAVRGCPDCARMLLKFGARVDMVGCDDGSPLMAAAKRGRLDVVRVLVRAGASIAYVDDDEDGGAVKNAVECAERFPEVRDWLLVGQYTETLLIGDGSGEEAEGADGVDNVVPWAGPVQIEYLLTGTAKEYGRRWHESLFQYLVRIAGVRKSLRGQVVVPYQPSVPDVEEPAKLVVISST